MLGIIINLLKSRFPWTHFSSKLYSITQFSREFYSISPGSGKVFFQSCANNSNVESQLNHCSSSFSFLKPQHPQESSDLFFNPGGFMPYLYSTQIHWRRKWQPTAVLLPGKSHGRRSLVGYRPWGHKESDMTEQLHFHFLSWSNNLQQRRQEYTMKKKQSLQKVVLWKLNINL